MARRRRLKRGLVVALVLEEEDVRLLDEIARREKISRSELVRRVLKDWLETEAKVRYGLQLAAPRLVEEADTSQLLPLSHKKLVDLERALEETRSRIPSLRERLQRAVEEAERLRRRLSELEEAERRGEVFLVGGRPARAGELRERILRELRSLGSVLREYRAARGRFFRLVYYPWLRYLRRDLPLETVVRVEGLIADALVRLDNLDKLAARLRSLIRA
jgi:hypothetical protein